MGESNSCIDNLCKKILIFCFPIYCFSIGVPICVLFFFFLICCLLKDSGAVSHVITYSINDFLMAAQYSVVYLNILLFR